MRVAVSVVLLLALSPIWVGVGQESGSLRVSAQDEEFRQGAKENKEQSSQLREGEKKPLTNVDVMSMVKAGLAESTIVLAIQHSSTVFDTSPQALISLKNQGVPPKVLDAMLTAGSEKQTSPAGPAVRNPTHLANIGEIGKWDVSEEVSPVDGSRTVILILPAEQEVSAMAGLDRHPRLYIGCKSHQTDVHIQTGSLPAGADKGGKYSVRLRLDDGQPIAQAWDESTGRDSLSAPHPVEFARILAASKRLAIEFTPSGSGPVATWFDLNGLDGALSKVANACGWSVQSGSTEGIEIQGRTPDLHTIRKVLLETDWADDDSMHAQKVKVIEKHTCLQVVDTSEAADATLSWSIEAFTGASLELLSKDGQVIWSKTRGLTPPLKALKQAVGCP